MAIQKFILAELRIRNYFKQSSLKVFNEKELNTILEERRGEWQLGVTHTLNKFIRNLTEKKILEEVNLDFYSLQGVEAGVPHRSIKRYITAGAGAFELALSINNKTYLSHYTAAYLNGLTTQVPKRIYVTSEQSKKPPSAASLTQEAMDRVFSQPQRIAGEQATWFDYTIIPLHGMYSNRLGVNIIQPIPHTNIERTLIDMAVRPAYSGGVPTVLDMYRNAMSRVSINKLLATLNNLKFVYPYHQAIGFYLEKAGYSEKQIAPFEAMAKEFDFYLTYEIKEKAYSDKWKLYYPTGM